MITSLRLVNFKNFADETLKVGPLTVIVGANASGKSNIRDAFRFLHGIGRGYTLAEIVGGKYGNSGHVEWAEIRGAPTEVARFQPVYPFSWTSMRLSVNLYVEGQNISYSITAGYNPHSPDGFRVLDESLKTGAETIYTAESPQSDGRLKVKIEEIREGPIALPAVIPVLTQLQPNFDWPVVSPDLRGNLYSSFRNIRFMDFSPSLMREPSAPGATVLGDSGQNLPTVLGTICADPTRKPNLMSWLGELTPMDVKDFEFPRDPSGRIHLQIVERNGRKVSAYGASDGTLRFLAMLAALLSPNRAGVYFFEDIDAGIHPARLWLLLDFIEKQTAMGDVQVITTTHSPALLTWMNDKTFEHTSIVYRDENWADSIIRPISELPNLRELRKSDTLGELFTENWMENMLAFSEGKSGTDYLDDEDKEV